jgi:hypothetical protein
MRDAPLLMHEEKYPGCMLLMVIGVVSRWEVLVKSRWGFCGRNEDKDYLVEPI